MSVHVTPGYAPRRRAFSLDEKPAVPHAYDDEFEGSVLDPKWTRAVTAGIFNDLTAIDPYAGFLAAAGGRSSVNSYRKSWYMAQPGATQQFRIRQTVSLPTDCFIWGRFSFNFRYNTAATDNDSIVSIQLLADTAGSPDENNQVFMHMNDGGVNAMQAHAGRLQAGVPASTTTQDVGPQTVGTDSLCQPICYAGIQKLNTTYNFYVGMPNGNWIALASQTQTSTLVYLTMTFGNAMTTTPGNMVLGCDFIRFRTGRYLP